MKRNFFFLPRNLWENCCICPDVFKCFLESVEREMGMEKSEFGDALLGGISTFSNQQKIRDEFFQIVSSFLPNFSGEFSSFNCKVKQLQEKIHCTNMHWYCGVFAEEYFNVCYVNRTSHLSNSSFANSSACTNIDNIQKLESRFNIKSNYVLASLFVRKELFFVKND